MSDTTDDGIDVFVAASVVAARAEEGFMSDAAPIKAVERNISRRVIPLSSSSSRNSSLCFSLNACDVGNDAADRARDVGDTTNAGANLSKDAASTEEDSRKWKANGSKAVSLEVVVERIIRA